MHFSKLCKRSILIRVLQVHGTPQCRPKQYRQRQQSSIFSRNSSCWVFVMMIKNVVQVTLSSCMSWLLCASWKSDNGRSQPEVSQKHICETVGQSYPSAKAVELLKAAESMGFGTLEDTTAPNNQKVVILKKRPYST